MHSANILDPIHPSLPVIWDHPDNPTPNLKPPFAHFIITHIYRVLEQGGYTKPHEWLKLYLTGSLCTYQYSETSDCDVGLFVQSDKLPEWSRAEMIGLMIEGCDGVRLPGLPYELQAYVVGRGIHPADLYKSDLRAGYSIEDHHWISPPDRRLNHDTKAQENGFYVYALEQADKMERMLRYEPDKAVDFWHQIHKRRMRDQKMGKGDHSESNIIYKFLSKRGLMPQIAQASGEHIAGYTQRQLQEMAQTLPQDQSQVIHQWPDGWTIKQPSTYGDLHREGMLMGNCWSPVNDELSPVWQSHPMAAVFPDDADWPYTLDDLDVPGMMEAPLAMDYGYRSLRDPNNIPHVSFFHDQRHPHWGNVILDPLGRHNSNPKDAYIKRLQDWAYQNGVQSVDGQYIDEAWPQFGEHIGGVADWEPATGYEPQNSDEWDRWYEVTRNWRSQNPRVHPDYRIDPEFNCMTNTENLIELDPTLQWREGWTRNDPGHAWGAHAWATTPEGEIVDPYAEWRQWHNLEYREDDDPWDRKPPKLADWTSPGQVNLTTQPPQNPMQEGPSPYANVQDWELNMAGATAEEARQWIMNNFPDVAFKVAEHLGGWAGIPEQMITIHLYGVSQPIVQQIVAKYGEDHLEEESVAVMPKGYESQLWENPTKKLAGWQDHFVNQIQPIAQAYDQLPTFDPNAVGAWQELANDSTRRANELRQRYNIIETDDPEPYGSTIPKGQQWAKLASQEMFKDLNRGNFAVSRANTEHPIWTPQQNVDFRIVHDILGHHASGGDFGWQGENQACGAHFPLLSPNAQRALMTECLGQTGSAIANKGFGPQKVGFMDHLLGPAQQTFGAHIPDGGFCHRHLRHGIYRLGQTVTSSTYTDVECPHCGQQFHDNGWMGYTPLINGQMGERTHYCPNCGTDTREVVHRPIPIGSNA